MSEARTVLGALKESGTSKFAQKLFSDNLVPSVTKAIELNDSEEENERRKKFHTPRMVSQGAHFAYTVPEPRPHYKPLFSSRKALEDLNLELDSELMDLINGAKVYYDEHKAIFPYSMAYAGFQFGQFAGQLGDGRVVNLFDLPDKNNVMQTFQLKGAGMTPFSRFADGKAVLRSSVREFIISEALHHIGIPSTRALQLTRLPQTRAMRSTYEPCAVYCRFAPSWIRLGNFDLCRYRQDHKSLVELSNFCISDVFSNGDNFPTLVDPENFKHDYFPDANEKISAPKTSDHITLEDNTKYELFFRHVVNLNAESVASWQAYGFLNGVLNTDNTSIMGLAMDFGPFSFLDKFQPQYTPNHDDVELRYSFANQPTAIWWNLTKFAQAMTTLIGAGPKHIQSIVENGLQGLAEETEQDIITRANSVILSAANEYKFRFTTNYARIMSKRLGLDLNFPIQVSNENLAEMAEKATEFNKTILEPLLQILYVSQIDYNNFFVKLQGYNGDFKTEVSQGFHRIDPSLLKVFFTEPQISKLEKHADGAAEADSGETRRLVECVETLNAWIDDFVTLMPSDYSSRYNLAKKSNPLFTPRAHIFEQVINDITDQQRDKLNDPDAEIDTSYLEKLYIMSVNPYDSSKWDENLKPEKVQDWTAHGDDDTKFMKQLTCSS
ncbi:LANO_0E03488g1_1 [Lachancea nothofagi CBS 11611]|uniref:Selenoprotein O n=1 Tax=Lachancea nothofagi CBS 11611 TaxID=1266666 RepID=A0A1G4JR55_9SACH|nr:LANO_0E03488g1_1 [Lachancea nothofagi CBS 11611]